MNNLTQEQLFQLVAFHLPDEFKFIAYCFVGIGVLSGITLLFRLDLRIRKIIHSRKVKKTTGFSNGR